MEDTVRDVSANVAGLALRTYDCRFCGAGHGMHCKRATGNQAEFHMDRVHQWNSDDRRPLGSGEFRLDPVSVKELLNILEDPQFREQRPPDIKREMEHMMTSLRQAAAADEPLTFRFVP